MAVIPSCENKKPADSKVNAHKKVLMKNDMGICLKGKVQ
jgi:hypothetical protein